jgi:hypothetical protein
LWHFGLQTFSQQGFSQQVGAQQAFSQQPFGAQQAFSQQPFSQQRSLWKRTGLAQQAGSGQQPFGASQHATGSHWQPLASNKSLTLANKSRTGVGRQTLHLAQVVGQVGRQAFSQQAGAHGFTQTG